MPAPKTAEIQILYQDLWEKLHSLTHEMIITTIGRWKFDVINKTWEIKSQNLPPHNIHHIHRYGIISGKEMMKGVAFDYLKLTNKAETSGPETILVETLRKYKLTFTIYKAKEGEYDPIIMHRTPDFLKTLKKWPIIGSYQPEFLCFIPVTIYMNTAVTKIKADNNAYSVSWRNRENAKKRKEQHETSQSSTPIQSPIPNANQQIINALQQPLWVNTAYPLANNFQLNYPLLNMIPNPYMSTYNATSNPMPPNEQQNQQGSNESSQLNFMQNNFMNYYLGQMAFSPQMVSMLGQSPLQASDGHILPDNSASFNQFPFSIFNNQLVNNDQLNSLAFNSSIASYNGLLGFGQNYLNQSHSEMFNIGQNTQINLANVHQPSVEQLLERNEDLPSLETKNLTQDSHSLSDLCQPLPLDLPTPSPDANAYLGQSVIKLELDDHSFTNL